LIGCFAFGFDDWIDDFPRHFTFAVNVISFIIYARHVRTMLTAFSTNFIHC
jgi:hypothetical protein